MNIEELVYIPLDTTLKQIVGGEYGPDKINEKFVTKNKYTYSIKENKWICWNDQNRGFGSVSLLENHLTTISNKTNCNFRSEAVQILEALVTGVQPKCSIDEIGAKEFYAECVKQIPLPAKTKTSLEMIQIVLQNTPIPRNQMFDDATVDKLFHNVDNKLLADAYKFIRDNKDLYLNPNQMSLPQINGILEHTHVMSVLKFGQFSPEDSKALLDNAIHKGMLEVIKHFMDKDIMPSLDTGFFIETLATDSKYVEILEYLGSKGIDLSEINEGRLIVSATLNNNSLGLEYLIKDFNLDMPIIKESFEKFLFHEYNNKDIRERNDLSGIVKRIMPTLHVLMDKVSTECFSTILETVNNPEMKDFLSNQYLMIDIQRKYSEESKKSSRPKI